MTEDHKYTVLDNVELAAGVYHLRLERNGDAERESPQPGRFAMVQVREGASPLLRRPLSYLFAGGRMAEFLYRRVGVGTRILSRAKRGDVLNVLGPLGTGYDTSAAKTRAILVAGGIGLPPLHFLARTLKAASVKTVELIHGSASGAESLLSMGLTGEGIIVHHVTEDGSRGMKGLATEMLEKNLETVPKPDVIYACGPHPMLKAVADIAAGENLPCQVSIEAPMACGIGACMGCAIRDAEGRYVQVCGDGPVFDVKILFGGK